MNPVRELERLDPSKTETPLIIAKGSCQQGRSCLGARFLPGPSGRGVGNRSCVGKASCKGFIGRIGNKSCTYDRACMDLAEAAMISDCVDGIKYGEGSGRRLDFVRAAGAHQQQGRIRGGAGSTNGLEEKDEEGEASSETSSHAARALGILGVMSSTTKLDAESGTCVEK